MKLSGEISIQNTAELLKMPIISRCSCTPELQVEVILTRRVRGHDPHLDAGAPPPSWHIINTQNHPKHWHLSLLVFNNHMTVSVGGCLRAMWVGLMPADRTKPGSKRTNSPPRNRPTDRPTSSMFPCQSRGRRVSVVTWSA